jgi:hypothetical protein
VVADLGAEAGAALERGDYARAADLYRTALAAEPQSLPLHYGLGVSASYLPRRDEAVRELTWVLERGEPDSTEVKAARRWLASVGALPRTPAPTAPRDEPQEPEPKRALASLQGRVLFGESSGDVAPLERIPLFLSDYPKRVVYRRVRTDEKGHFRIANLPPGTYKLTDQAAGEPRWRLRVELKPGEETTLDLVPSNSTKVRDDFPDRPQG